MIGLGDFPGGEQRSGATDVSADGAIIVGYGESEGGRRAVLWKNGEMIELDVPYRESLAEAVSSDGSVVVGSADYGGAFIWDAIQGGRSIPQLLREAAVLPTGWAIESAEDVNITPEGAAIVTGEVRLPTGEIEPYIAQIPMLPRFLAIGALSGGTFRSIPRALSNDGSSVVGASGAPTSSRAFVWTPKRGLSSLGADAVDATGVSHDGSVVAGGATQNRAFFWTNDGILWLFGGSARMNATSADGSATVGSVAPGTANETVHRWTWSSTERYVTYMGTRAVPARANAISANGSVFVGSILPHTFGGVAYTSRAFLWRSTGGQQALGDLPGGTVESEATAISADGTVVVGWSRSANGPEAFRWTPTGGMVPLGDLPGPGFASRATAVSPDGKIVLGLGVANGKNRVFIWDGTNGMRDLQNVMAARGLTAELAGWTLTGATGVTNGPSGTLIVAGTGIDPLGRTQGFWASLPPVAATIQP